MHQVQKVQEAYFLISLSPDYLPDPAIDHCCIVLKMHFHEDLSRSTRRSLIFKKSEICKNHDRDLSRLVKNVSIFYHNILGCCWHQDSQKHCSSFSKFGSDGKLMIVPLRNQPCLLDLVAMRWQINS